MNTPQFSGADLARMALANARAAASKNPAVQPRRTAAKRTVHRGSGRDPISLAAAITALGADLPLENGLAGGNLLDRWPELCPQYVGRVDAAGYDEQTGRLDLRPSSHAYAAQVRLLGGQLAKQINDKMGRPVVRTIRVLPVGNITAVQTPTIPVEQPKVEVPVKTRDMACPGYQATLEAALTNRPERQPADPYVLEAMARQEAALRAGRQPEHEHIDGQWEIDRLTRPEPDRGEALRRAALARKRLDQTRGDAAPRRLFDAA